MDKAFEAPTVFKDESKLSIEYVPSRLPHRDGELQALIQTFKAMVESPGSIAPKALLRGPLGTGKTALAKRFGMDFEAYASKKGVKLKFIHINCREEGSFYSALRKIVVNFFRKKVPSRGYSSEELLSMLSDILDSQNIFLLLALDEVEILIRKEGSDPLFNLTRIGEAKPPEAPRRMALITIFREPECDEALKLLDRSTRSTLGHNIIKLNKYSSSQLQEILSYRIEEAFKEDTVLPETVELAADLAGKYGDARLAIELIWLAGKHADLEHSSKVLPDHVRAAQLKIAPTIRRETLEYLTLHEKIMLLSLARSLEASDSAYASFGEVEKEYRVACEEYGEKPRRHTQLWKYIKSMSLSGVIQTKVSGKGFRGKTTLLGLAAPTKILREELEKILASKSEPA
jgi:cell division control protein 6